MRRYLLLLSNGEEPICFLVNYCLQNYNLLLLAPVFLENAELIIDLKIYNYNDGGQQCQQICYFVSQTPSVAAVQLQGLFNVGGYCKVSHNSNR